MRALVERAGSFFHVDPRIVAAVIEQESGFNPRAVSPAGAQGMGQFMPETAKGLGITDPFDPYQAVGGVALNLATLLRQFHGNLPLALAAYNAGAGAVERARGIPAIPETQQYVRSIMAMLGAR